MNLLELLLGILILMLIYVIWINRSGEGFDWSPIRRSAKKAFGWTLFVAICCTPFIIFAYFSYDLGKIFFGWFAFVALVLPTLFVILSFFLTGASIVASAGGPTSTDVDATTTTETISSPPRIRGAGFIGKLKRFFNNSFVDEAMIAISAIGVHEAVLTMMQGENIIINFKKGVFTYVNGTTKVKLRGDFAAECQLDGTFMEKIIQFVITKFNLNQVSNIANSHACRVLSTFSKEQVYTLNSDGKIDGINVEILAKGGPFDNALDNYFKDELNPIEEAKKVNIVNVYPQSLEVVEVIHE